MPTDTGNIADSVHNAATTDNVPSVHHAAADNPNQDEINQNPQVGEVLYGNDEAEINTEDGTEGKVDCKCLFCGKNRKTVKRREDKLSIFTSIGLNSIKDLATRSNDEDMKQKLENVQPDVLYFYHKTCKTSYVNSRELVILKKKIRPNGIISEISVQKHMQLLKSLSMKILFGKISHIF